jgi:hypothetical protein
MNRYSELLDEMQKLAHETDLAKRMYTLAVEGLTPNVSYTTRPITKDSQ